MRIIGDTRGMLKPGGRPTTLVWTRKGGVGGGEELKLVVGGRSFKIAVNMSAENNDGLVWLCI